MTRSEKKGWGTGAGAVIEWHGIESLSGERSSVYPDAQHEQNLKMEYEW